jgi:hypothetical protein
MSQSRADQPPPPRLSSDLSDKGISDATFTGVEPLLNESGQPFAPLTLGTSLPVVPVR